MPASVSTAAKSTFVTIFSLSSGAVTGTRCSVALTSVIFRRLYLPLLAMTVSLDRRSKSNRTRHSMWQLSLDLSARPFYGSSIGGDLKRRISCGKPFFSLVVTPDIQKIADLKGKKIGVTFGGSTAAGTKALLDLNKLNPDKDVEYINFPGNEPKIAAMKQGIISAALLAPPADYL